LLATLSRSPSLKCRSLQLIEVCTHTEEEEEEEEEDPSKYSGIAPDHVTSHFTCLCYIIGIPDSTLSSLIAGV